MGINSLVLNPTQYVFSRGNVKNAKRFRRIPGKVFAPAGLIPAAEFAKLSLRIIFPYGKTE